MNNADLEVWTRSLVDRVMAGSAIEDDVVECKFELPAPEKAARQLAGFANAARAPEVLLLVGVDESPPRVKDARVEDSGRWWAQVQKGFDGLAPDLLIDIDVRTDHGTVHAMLFGTTRAPFLVSVPGRTDPLLEVPWRVATGTRSAKREELLEVIVPRVAAPQLEILDAWLTIRRGAESETLWELHITAYIETTSQAIFPDHRVEAILTPGHGSLSKRWSRIVLESVQLRAPFTSIGGGHPHLSRGGGSATTDLIHQGRHQLIVDGPGRVVLDARTVLRGEIDLFGVDVLDAHVRCRAVGRDEPMEIRLELERTKPDPDDSTLLERFQIRPEWRSV